MITIIDDALQSLPSVKERPILFSSAMVRAILEGRKTQTRRVLKEQPPVTMTGCVCCPDCGPGFACPHGVPGDRLWVRESMMLRDAAWVYRADESLVLVDPADESAMLVWAHHKDADYCPSIHMPRWASRITLEITDVRVQRLQEISEEDAHNEGVEREFNGFKSYQGGSHVAYATTSFASLWDSINAKRGFGWDSNPWVWAITFERMT